MSVCLNYPRWKLIARVGNTPVIDQGRRCSGGFWSLLGKGKKNFGVWGRYSWWPTGPL